MLLLLLLFGCDVSRFDETLANQVKELSHKLVSSAELIEVEPAFLEFQSSQKRELLSQILDQVVSMSLFFFEIFRVRTEGFKNRKFE